MAFGYTLFRAPTCLPLGRASGVCPRRTENMNAFTKSATAMKFTREGGLVQHWAETNQ